MKRPNVSGFVFDAPIMQIDRKIENPKQSIEVIRVDFIILQICLLYSFTIKKGPQ